MSEEELDLSQLSAIHMAQFCAGPAQIMGSKMIELQPLRAPSNDIPDDVLGNPFAPWRPVTADGTEDPACRNVWPLRSSDQQLPLPKGALAQFECDRPCQPYLRWPSDPCLIWKSSTSRLDSSARRNPQPRSTEIMARSRRLRRSLPSAVSRSIRA
jgi:hypothetical protein